MRSPAPSAAAHRGTLRRPRAAPALLAAVLLLPAAGCSPEAAKPGGGPPRHVFLIVVDTLRADHLGCYGASRPTSPTIDALAAAGVVFEQAYATSSNTLESVASLVTSTSPLAHRIHEGEPPVELITLPQRFAAAGFRTLAVISNPWLAYHREFFGRGFDEYEFVGDELESWDHNTTDRVAEELDRLLERRFDPQRRNFVYLHHLDPHDAYVPPVDYGFYQGRPVRFVSVHEVSGQDQLQRRHARDPDFTGRPTPQPVSPAELRHMIARYDAELRYVDDTLAELVEWLRERDLLDDSLIAVTSDHGEEFLEHGCFKHGFQLYEESVRVPLILHWPAGLPPARRQEPVSGIDVPVTLLARAGVGVPETMRGRDLFDAGEVARPVVLSTHFVNQVQRAMRWERHKVIHDLRAGTLEIYDLHEDPGETRNLWVGDRAPWSDLLDDFEAAMAEHARPVTGPRGPAPELDERTRQQLESLGYL